MSPISRLPPLAPDAAPGRRGKAGKHTFFSGAAALEPLPTDTEAQMWRGRGFKGRSAETGMIKSAIALSSVTVGSTKQPILVLSLRKDGRILLHSGLECQGKKWGQRIFIDGMTSPSLTRSPTLSPAFQGGDKKRGSGLTPNKPRHSCRGLEGLTCRRPSGKFGLSRRKKRTGKNRARAQEEPSFP